MGDRTSRIQEGIAVSAKHHACSSDNVQAMSSATDGMMHIALQHRQSLLCQGDGVNFADSFRMGRKEFCDQSSLPRTPHPTGSVDAPHNVVQAFVA